MRGHAYASGPEKGPSRDPQYKRATKKAYEIQGIRTALDDQALWAYHRVSESDYAREMSEKFRTLPLKEYFNLRDDPYKENKVRMDEILARSKK